jgi:uncharacterized protein (DUF608 family)
MNFSSFFPKPSITVLVPALGLLFGALCLMAQSADEPRTYRGEYLTGIDFPVGAVGGSVIRMNGKAERAWWHIFGNHESRAGSGVVPNSFFAVRASQGKTSVVKALQTSAVGPFEPMSSLTFRSDYPFGRYDFADDALPVSVSMEAYSFLIPMNAKDSGIPSAVFRFTVSNPGKEPVDASLLGTQQNAVGFDGYGTISGPLQRSFPGFGSNRNRVVAGKGYSALEMTGDAGSMVLAVYDDDATATASWESKDALHADFSADGRVTGVAEAASPAPGETIDGALARSFPLKPGESRTVTFVLSWHIPGTSFGLPKSKSWYFPQGGNQYENWWQSAAEVNKEVFSRFAELDAHTRLYRDTIYASNIPHFLIDRLTSNISVLQSPTSFWTKSGYYGLWESTSDKQEWLGNCKHVYHYAQSHARLFPELGRQLRKQDLDSMVRGGLLPARDGDEVDALDGHFGGILSVYREHLLSADNAFLTSVWPQTRKAMEYAIATYDPDRDGMLTGTYHNTLDCNSSGTSPWSGSLYLAATKAAERMAQEMGHEELARAYGILFETGRKNQNGQLWDETLGYYVERPQKLPGTRLIGDGASIDMFLGQWWANQLDLGTIYPEDRTRSGLMALYQGNRIADDGSYRTRYRDFLGTGDTGWKMLSFPGELPKPWIHYHDEVMSGFEYSMAATLLQYGMLDQGLEVIRAIYNRYDGRHRGKEEVRLASNATVFGTGSPVGEDECGDFYGRAMSSWSALLALQGFQYHGPRGAITFQPRWQPENHASFFTAAEGWGLFTQRRQGETQTGVIGLRYGKLTLRSLTLEIPEGQQVTKAVVRTTAGKIKHAIQSNQREIRIALDGPLMLAAGDELTVELSLEAGAGG